MLLGDLNTLLNMNKIKSAWLDLATILGMFRFMHIAHHYDNLSRSIASSGK